MSESEAHTLKTIKTGESNISGILLGNEDGGPNSSVSAIIVSDNEEEPIWDNPSIIEPGSTSTSVNPDNAYSSTSLETACQEGNLSLVSQLLTDENINSGALHHAAACNQWRTCKLLLSRGADVNSKIEPLNATPLLWAARHGHAYIVKLLLDHGADPNIFDSSGFTLLHLAVHSSNVLMVAYTVHLEVEVDQPDGGNRTPLHWAIVQGDHLSVEVLLKSGASPNVADGEGALPLHLAMFSAQSELIVALLLQHGADTHSIDLSNPPKAWTQGCRIAGRHPNGTVIKSRFLTPELAKCVTTLTPIIGIPFALKLPSLLNSNLLGIPLGLLLVWQAKRWLASSIIPNCWVGEKAVLQSTLLSGIFIAIFGAASLFWLTYVLSPMAVRSPWMTCLLIVLLVLVTGSYAASMLMDPGKIEPKSLAVRRKGMNDLLERGLFDSVHLCIRSFVVIPARAQYDFYLERVICRYDHYCPWIYNAVGVRNHRVFVIFVLSVAVIIPLAGWQFFEYSREFGSTSYANGIIILIVLQAVWVYALSIVQILQISRGATSYEASHAEQLILYKTDPIKAYSSLPKDHPKAQEVLGGSSSSAASLRKHHGHSGHQHDKKAPLWARLTGFSQVSSAWSLVSHRMNVNKTDFGVGHNCIDFWCAGGNMLRPDGTMSALGGKPIDYASAITLPSQPLTESDQILP